MADDVINLDFQEWNKKISNEVKATPAFLPLDDKHTGKYTSQKWESLLEVANSEHLLIKSHEFLTFCQKNKQDTRDPHFTMLYRSAYIIRNFSFICKNFDIPWIYIYQDVNQMAEKFYNNLDFSIRFELQMIVILLLYCRFNNLGNNIFLREIMSRMLMVISHDDFQEIKDTIHRFY